MIIAVCDDNKQDMETVSGLIYTYFSERSVEYKLVYYETSQELLCSVIDEYRPDIIFLDVYTDNYQRLGIDVAKELRKENFDGKIIFTASTPIFAVESYDVNASGYLMKPYSYTKLCSVMNRIIINYSINSYSVKRRSSVVRIPYNDIVFVESINSKCVLHRSDGSDYTVYKRLSDIENELNDSRFLRCHQSYLVNMNYISKADKSFMLFSGDIVSIRQRNLRSIKKQYFEYIKNKHDIQYM